MSRFLASLVAGLFACSVLAVTPAAQAASGSKPAAGKQTNAKSGSSSKKASKSTKKSTSKKSSKPAA